MTTDTPTTLQGSADLADRVVQFNALRLPGQMPMMHMGTSYLVNDLWREVQRLQSVNADMLAALRNALTVLVAMESFIGSERMTETLEVDVVGQATRAIAKAEGRS